MDILETVPKTARNPYIIETSLSVLRGRRMRQLQETNCVYLAPGVESWASYSDKAGIGPTIGRAKLEKVVQHIEELFRYVQGLQINFMLGTDADEGDEPFELTKEFIYKKAFAWPTINIPTPFGRRLCQNRGARQRGHVPCPSAFTTPRIWLRP